MWPRWIEANLLPGFGPMTTSTSLNLAGRSIRTARLFASNSRSSLRITSAAIDPIRRIVFVRFSIMGVLSSATMEKKMSEDANIPSENTNMSSSAEFAQNALQNHIAPRSMGPIKQRLRHARYVLAKRKWTANRVRDLWYRDERASDPKADEILDIEELTGLKYARQELKQVDDLILRADARLLGSNDPDFDSAFVAAIRAFFSASRGSGTRKRPD